MTPEQVSAVVNEIRERVKERHEKTVPALPDFRLPALDPLAQARDAAEGKVAAIGTVNPRPPGVVNSLIQAAKRRVARALNWFVRDQVDFNQAVLRHMDAQLEVAIEQNYAILRVAKTVGVPESELKDLRRQVDQMLDHLKDLRSQVDQMLDHWKEWRPALEEKLTRSEIELLHSVREIEEGAREREAAFEDRAAARQQDYLQAIARAQAEYTEALERANDEIQARFWKDMETFKVDQDRLVHTELRLIRQRAAAHPQTAAAQPEAALPPKSGDGRSVPQSTGFDYGRFEERFRGDDNHVKQSQLFYLPYFKDCHNIVDLGCGRGEFLELAGAQGITAVGVDSNPEAVAACKEKGLDIRPLDLFVFLDQQPDGSLGGAFCSHVIEHLPAERLPEMIRLVAQKLEAEGVFAVETPNPGCLAIFAGDFYLDPTHQRPVPSQQLHFYLQEAGFTAIEIQERHPASEAFPELAALDEIAGLRGFRGKFFGGLDYAVVARKLKL